RSHSLTSSSVGSRPSSARKRTRAYSRSSRAASSSELSAPSPPTPCPVVSPARDGSCASVTRLPSSRSDFVCLMLGPTRRALQGRRKKHPRNHAKRHEETDGQDDICERFGSCC